MVYVKSLSEVSNVDNTFGGCSHQIRAAASMAKRFQREQHTEVFTVAELNWFSRNSYNLALKVCARWKAEQTLRILRCGIQVGALSSLPFFRILIP